MGRRASLARTSLDAHRPSQCGTSLARASPGYCGVLSFPRTAVVLALSAVFSACSDDGLFRIGERDATIDGSPTALDTGILTPDSGETVPDSGVLSPDAGVGRHKIVWVRAPSSGGSLAAPGGEHRMQVRLPPPTAHSESAGVEHNVESVMAGRAQGGNR